MDNFNPKLAAWLKKEPATEAGLNNIQIPGKTRNLVWQNRYREPTRYEQELVSQLESAFAEGIVELGELVATLNRRGLRNEAGEAWTLANFQDEMARLGY
ncbi:recombinase-like helix-turn-helix domain-containing protein [Oceanimonas doudoroffii]|uniref:Recombinase-like domain-containing protein n=1 Tax=Oceanimonas doudoroffii TaxID=84158 RepID=A0A233RIY9_9GAMM|nr:recombinase-like helix-turn-helix domain-containing protein [Oceanimonas doudoroffii]OXY83357.1 hypothetical protein B6S08_07680 [Oceanimonas doudoroffii]